MGLFDEQEIKSTMEELENIANKIAMPKTDEKITEFSLRMDNQLIYLLSLMI